MVWISLIVFCYFPAQTSLQAVVLIPLYTTCGPFTDFNRTAVKKGLQMTAFTKVNPIKAFGLIGFMIIWTFRQ